MLLDKIIFLVNSKFKSNNITFTKYLENDKLIAEIYDNNKIVAKFDLLELYEGCIYHGNHFFTDFIEKLKEHLEKRL